MAKDQVIAVNDAVHKVQLAMLDGITDQKQLFAAGNLISRFDYEDVVTERTIEKLCGYPLCRSSLPSEVSKSGHYRVSLKAHKVYDLQETRKFCSADCLINSRAFSRTLQEARTSDFDTGKLNEILRLFDDSNVEDDLVKELGFSKLTIRENVEVGGGELPLEEWMGPSNAVEGYVPFNRSNNESRKGKHDSKAAQNNQEKPENLRFGEMDFSSKVIFSDEYSVSKLPPQTKQDSPLGEPENDEGKTVLREQPAVSPSKKISKFCREKERDRKNAEDGKGKTVVTERTAVHPRKYSSLCEDLEMEKLMKKFGFDEMCSEIMSDRYNVEYNVSKKPPCSMKDPLSCHLKGLHTLDGKNALSGSCSGSNIKGSRTKPENLGKKINQGVCSSNENVTKSCLKISGSKKPNRSVTWADQNDGHGDLCEVRNNDIETGSSNLSSTNPEDVNSVSRLALAEAYATALSQAAKAVSSGDSDASDAIAEAGIVLLPSSHQPEEEDSEEDSEEEMTEEEPTLLKWPNKPGVPDSEWFDRDQSWFDGPPEGFSLNLSSFAMMWDTLFGWVSTSSLAYIYGKDESAHEEFLSVNGKEYIRKIIIGDGLSSEIKETIAGCLARALPRVATDLRLPIAISELEKGLGSLLETMSLTGAVPSFKFEEWLVIVLLFLDALSVSRIPGIAPYVLNRNKVLEGSGIGSEEFETMKDILLPLGRVPQFTTRSGA